MTRFVICAASIAIGLFFEISAVIGVYRFDTALRRMHAAALGVMVAGGLNLAAVKCLLLIFLLWNTSPIASHLIGKLEIETNENLAREVVSWKR